MCMVFSYFRYHECNLIETLMNYRLHLGKDTIYKKKNDPDKPATGCQQIVQDNNPATTNIL